MCARLHLQKTKKVFGFIFINFAVLIHSQTAIAQTFIDGALEQLTKIHTFRLPKKML